MKTLFLVFVNFSFVFMGLSQQNNIEYDFPIRPNTKDWQAIKSIDEMYAVCQIPENILSNLTTEAILKSCLNYPAAAVLMIYNSAQLGFDTWKKSFNGIRELLNRKDAKDVIVKYYESFDIDGHKALKTSIEKGGYTFKISILESMLVQDEIINSKNTKEQKALLKLCFNKYKEKQADQVYGPMG